LTTALAILCGGSLQACSTLPRVVVLHDPLNAQEHVTLGVAYERKDRLDLAIQEYQVALRQEGTYIPALMGLGNASYTNGALVEAESYYLQVLSLARDHPGANNNLAMVYLVQDQRLKEAEALANHALERGGPLRPRVLDTLARIYMKQGRCREANAALQDAEAATPLEETSIRDRLQQLRQELRTKRCQPHEQAE